jgi:RecA-family ATPase
MTEIPTVQAFDDFERVALPVIKPYRSQFGAVWFHEAGRKPPRREWLIKDLILARSFGIVYGPPGSGKSFLVSDLMLTCAAAALTVQQDVSWFGYKVNPFGVVYIVAEGADDFMIRLHAWRITRAIDPNAVLPFVFLPTSIDLRSENADTPRLIEEIKSIDIEMWNKCGVRVGAVVIDTFSRAIAGGNENDSAVMTSLVKHCGQIQEAVNVAIIGVHHGGKEAGRGPRGHEALLGAADFSWEVIPRSDESPTNKWIIRKFKAGPFGRSHDFVLNPITVDKDDDGDDITSCVVAPRDPNERTKVGGENEEDGVNISSSEIDFLSVLAIAIEQNGVPKPQGHPSGRNVSLIVSNDKVRELFWDRYSVTEVGTEEHKRERLKKRWQRATKGLLRKNIIAHSDGYLWFTGRKAKGIRPRGIVEEYDRAPRSRPQPDDALLSELENETLGGL